MILNNNLQFIFPPVKFGENPSSIQVLPFQTNKETQILVFYNYFGSNEVEFDFYLFDTKGNMIKEKTLIDNEHVISRIFRAGDKSKNTFYFLKNRNSDIFEIDSSFQTKRTLRIPTIQSGIPISELDADLDGNKELIFDGNDKNTLIFTQSDFILCFCGIIRNESWCCVNTNS